MKRKIVINIIGAGSWGTTLAAILARKGYDINLWTRSGAPYKEIKNTKKNTGKRSLKEVYDEFWEDIDDNNVEFKEFIEKDKRRLKLKLGII